MRREPTLAEFFTHRRPEGAAQHYRNTAGHYRGSFRERQTPSGLGLPNQDGTDDIQTFLTRLREAEGVSAWDPQLTPGSVNEARQRLRVARNVVTGGFRLVLLAPESIAVLSVTTATAW